MDNRPPDMIVVGAGIIGLACAFRLQREGSSVLLIDRGQPGMGASFGNAGHIATEQLFPLSSPAVIRGALGYLFDRDSPLRIHPRYLPQILPWLVRFTWAARPASFVRGTAALASLQATAAKDFADLLHDAGASRLLHMTGHLVLVEKPASVTAARREQAELAQCGIATTWLAPSDVAALAPDIAVPVAGALQFHDSGHVDDPYAVCTALFDAFRAAGGGFLQEPVTSLCVNTGGFRLSTGGGRKLFTPRVLLAAGAWSRPLAEQCGYPVPLDTERGYHLTLPGATPRFQIPVASFERKVIMTPMSIGLRMTGTVEFGGLELPPEPHRFTLLREHLKALLPNTNPEEASMWMGFRPSLPDHLPVLGRAPSHPGLFMAFGHQHLGLTLAGVTARIIADVCAGRTNDTSLAPFAADRFGQQRSAKSNSNKIPL
jgi:D-amino-acid dehydrogenase